MLLHFCAILLGLAPADHHDRNLRIFLVKLFKVRCESIAGTAMRVRKDQQYASSSQFLQREFTVTIEARQAKARRGGPGFQAVAIDPAPRHRALAESIYTGVPCAGCSSPGHEPLIGF